MKYIAKMKKISEQLLKLCKYIKQDLRELFDARV